MHIVTPEHLSNLGITPEMTMEIKRIAAEQIGNLQLLEIMRMFGQ